MLVDEATASLDPQTASQINQVLLEKEGLTLIAITHRTNQELLEAYDEVLVLEQGELLEHGSYGSLSPPTQAAARIDWGGTDMVLIDRDHLFAPLREQCKAEQKERAFCWREPITAVRFSWKASWIYSPTSSPARRRSWTWIPTLCWRRRDPLKRQTGCLYFCTPIPVKGICIFPSWTGVLS